MKDPFKNIMYPTWPDWGSEPDEDPFDYLDDEWKWGFMEEEFLSEEEMIIE